jgi:hypothetical protein
MGVALGNFHLEDAWRLSILRRVLDRAMRKSLNALSAEQSDTLNNPSMPVTEIEKVEAIPLQTPLSPGRRKEPQL